MITHSNFNLMARDRDRFWNELLTMTAADRPFQLQQQARYLRAETLASLFRGIAKMFSFAQFKAWRQRRAYVRELMELDDHALADIGLVRGDLKDIARGTFDPAIQQARRTWTLRQPAVPTPDQGQEAVAPDLNRAA